MNRKALIFAALAVVLVGAPLLSKLTRGDNAKEVELGDVVAQKVQSSILAAGTLAYRQQVQLRSEVIAKVTELYVIEADTVGRGDLIIGLDPEAFQAQVEQQEATVRLQRIAIEWQQLNIESLSRSFARRKDLYERKMIDQDSFESAGSELELAKVDLRSREEALSQALASLAQARERLGKTQIRSPIDGIAIQVDVKVGETVIAGTTNIPGSTLVVIADPSEMLAEVQVDEADIASVRVGQAADIFAASDPDKPLAAVVESIATVARREVGQQGLSFLVKARLLDPAVGTARSGMSARADIYTQTSENALSIPIQSVLYDDSSSRAEGEGGSDGKTKQEDEKPYVMVVKDGVARRRDVKLGLSSDSDQEIIDGLIVGESIVVGPYRILRHLKDGDEVKPAAVADNTDDDE